MSIRNVADTITKLKLFLGILFVIMLVFSKYATSSCIILFIALSFYNIFFPNGVWNPQNGIIQIKLFFKHPAFWAITLVFWVIVLGYFNSENTNYWLSRVRLRLPFLALPVVFFFLPWSKIDKDSIILFSIILIFIVSTGVVVNYLNNYNTMSDLIRSGSSIPVPMKDHVRYAQLEAFVLLTGVYWLITNRSKALLNKIVGVLLSFIFIYLHILAVRSGILIAYTGLFCFFILYIKKLKLKHIMLVLVLTLTIPFIAYKTIPSLEAKISYGVWEWNKFIEGDPLNNSDSGRWISYKLGLDYFESEPLFGIGPGDLEDKMTISYKEKYPDIASRKQPHNQFLHTMACSGIFGLIFFLFAFAVPFFTGLKTHNQILVVIIVASFASFMVESPLETARGTALIAFWICLFLKDKDLTKLTP
ncbi:MAG TPA: O-antigen ligase family protein [Saprospiraceae bacterium]|nr:O-antigen ligase family protein [Saprospiraceae bacterium]